MKKIPVNNKAKAARDILRMRLGMMFINEGIRAGRFKIPIHLAFGHEAIAAAVKAVMTRTDRLVLSHRNIHYNLALADSLRAEIDEFLLKKTGVARGQLGSMNLANAKKGIVYSSSILGNNLGVAAGLALGKKVKGEDGLVIVVSGDGAMEEGAFHESLLFLKSNCLSSIIIVENNEWSLATRICERRCDVDLKKYASAFGIRYEKLAGNDVYDYIKKLKRLRRHALRARTPVCAEVQITTLGSWRMKNEEFPDGKFINYHHGLAPTVSPSPWPVLEASANDPVFALQGYFGEEELKAMARDLFSRLQDEANELR